MSSDPSGRKGYRRIAPSRVRVRLHVRHHRVVPSPYIGCPHSRDLARIAERLRGLEVDSEVVFDRLLNGRSLGFATRLRSAHPSQQARSRTTSWLFPRVVPS